MKYRLTQSTFLTVIKWNGIQAQRNFQEGQVFEDLGSRTGESGYTVLQCDGYSLFVSSKTLTEYFEIELDLAKYDQEADWRLE